jgi:antitoxin MazE
MVRASPPPFVPPDVRQPAAVARQVTSNVGLKIFLDHFSHNVYTLDIHRGGSHMLAKIQKWGNSQGLRLAKNLLADAQLGIGDEVDISVKDGIMVVTPAKKIRGRHKLKDLVARIPEKYQTCEVEWGEPVGKEAW